MMATLLKYKYSLLKQCLLPFIVLLFFAGILNSQNRKIVILHTNDTHSNIMPSDPGAARQPDMGGYARRLGVINQIRAQEELVLLVDAGDYWQGTPFFNFFGGRVEIEGFNRMQYDAVTLGNHEFDNGVDSLALMLSKANFPVVVSNYDVSSSVLAPIVKPWLVLEKGGLRIGIMGLGVNLENLIVDRHKVGVHYKDPVQVAREVSTYLKMNEKCDLIICLSHLGSDSTKLAVNDFDIARQTEHIDVIIGGHSHQLLVDVNITNAAGKTVLLQQMGRNGFYLGRIDVELSPIE